MARVFSKQSRKRDGITHTEERGPKRDRGIVSACLCLDAYLKFVDQAAITIDLVFYSQLNLTRLWYNPHLIIVVIRVVLQGALSIPQAAHFELALSAQEHA